MLTESPPHSVEQKVESWISLPCAASGSPQPTVQWYCNAVPVNNTDRSVQRSVFMYMMVRDIPYVNFKYMCSKPLGFPVVL